MEVTNENTAPAGLLKIIYPTIDVVHIILLAYRLFCLVYIRAASNYDCSLSPSEAFYFCLFYLQKRVTCGVVV